MIRDRTLFGFRNKNPLQATAAARSTLTLHPKSSTTGIAHPSRFSKVGHPSFNKNCIHSYGNTTNGNEFDFSDRAPLWFRTLTIRVPGWARSAAVSSKAKASELITLVVLAEP